MSTKTDTTVTPDTTDAPVQGDGEMTEEQAEQAFENLLEEIFEADAEQQGSDGEVSNGSDALDEDNELDEDGTEPGDDEDGDDAQAEAQFEELLEELVEAEQGQPGTEDEDAQEPATI